MAHVQLEDAEVDVEHRLGDVVNRGLALPMKTKISRGSPSSVASIGA